MKEINVKEIKRVLKHVRGDMRRLDMATYGVLENTPSAAEYKNFPACGTKACLAGWTVLLNTPKKNWNKLFTANDTSYAEAGLMKDGTHEKAAKILGFNEAEAETIFTGASMYTKGAKAQYKELVEDINQVLKNRGMKERVK